jgi:hypothetical protein
MIGEGLGMKADPLQPVFFNEEADVLRQCPRGFPLATGKDLLLG